MPSVQATSSSVGTGKFPDKSNAGDSLWKNDGIVTGNLACHGLLALEKKSVLTGNLKVGSLTIADGAKHNGQVRMGPF